MKQMSVVIMLLGFDSVLCLISLHLRITRDKESFYALSYVLIK